MTLGESIRYYREKRGMSLRELADASGVAKSSVARYEADAVDMPLSRVNDVAKALGVEPWDLLGWDAPTGYRSPEGLAVDRDPELRMMVRLLMEDQSLVSVVAAFVETAERLRKA